MKMRMVMIALACSLLPGLAPRKTPGSSCPNSDPWQARPPSRSISA